MWKKDFKLLNQEILQNEIKSDENSIFKSSLNFKIGNKKFIPKYQNT